MGDDVVFGVYVGECCLCDVLVVVVEVVVYLVLEFVV